MDCVCEPFRGWMGKTKDLRAFERGMVVGAKCTVCVKNCNAAGFFMLNSFPCVSRMVHPKGIQPTWHNWVFLMFGILCVEASGNKSPGFLFLFLLSLSTCFYSILRSFSDCIGVDPLPDPPSPDYSDYKNFTLQFHKWDTQWSPLLPLPFYSSMQFLMGFWIPFLSFCQSLLYILLIYCLW